MRFAIYACARASVYVHMYIYTCMYQYDLFSHFLAHISWVYCLIEPIRNLNMRQLIPRVAREEEGRRLNVSA